MPARTKTRGGKRSNSNSNSNTNTKAKPTKNVDDIANMAKNVDEMESKCESGEESDEHYKAEHYLIRSKTMSKALFTAIDVLDEEDIVPLKEHVKRHPRNARIKQAHLEHLRAAKYRKWLIELKSGFNLLFYGVGSKKEVLEDFVTLFCCHDPRGITLRVNGFLDEVTMKVVIEKGRATKTKKNGIRAGKGLVQRATLIVEYLDALGVELEYSYFYILVHNLTGASLRKGAVQRAWSILANSQWVHIVASMDHIHGLLLWDRNHLSMLHWIYHELTTFEHYAAETEFAATQSIKVTQSKEQGLEHVMSSLTPQHRDIIENLAEHQIESGGDGLSEAQWYEKCMNAMLVSNTLKFQQYITEFLDHHVIQKQVAKGNVLYVIPYDRNVIQQQLIDYEIN